MSRPRNNRDNLFVIVGLVIVSIGIKKVIGNDGYTKEFGNWFWYGGIIIAAGILDPILALTGKKDKEDK